MTPPVRRAQPGGTPEQLQAIVDQSLAGLPTAPAGTTVAFVTQVVRFVAEWLEHRASVDLSVLPDAIFLLPEYPVLLAQQHGFERIRFFDGDPRQDVAGNVHVCNSTLREVFVRASDPKESTSTVIEGLIRDGLGALPAVIFAPAIGKITLAFAGLENEDDTVVLPIADTIYDVTAASLDEFLEDFHDIHLKTPQSFKKFWQNKDKFVPVPNAEKEVQNALLPLAHLRFRKSVVRAEESMVEGRADVTITPDPRGTTRGSGVLELKVLRSRFPGKKGGSTVCSPATNDQAVVDGIDQAMSYRARRHYDHAFVCCYDFRTEADATDLAAHEPLATSRNVLLRQYRVYNHAKALRRDDPESAYRAAKAAGLVK